MRTHTPLAILLTIAFAPLPLAAAPQDSRTALSERDRSEIQELVAQYARSLGSCAAEAYADLFAPQTGYFASNIRGEVAGRDRLIALVRSERHCNPSGGLATPTGAAAGPARPSNVPAVTIEERQAVPGDRQRSPLGATGRADLGNAGGYEDEYVKTPAGWRFQSRTVISRQEREAGLTSREIAAIRRLAGTDLGFFDDVYVTGPDGIRRFRASGVAMGLSSDGVTGRAALKGGGRYEDVYVRMPQGGWRFKSRVYVPDDAPPSVPATGAAR